MNRETDQTIERRYPLSYGVKYVIGPPEDARTGFGKTVWMSRGEVAFLTEQPACVGEKLSICVEWPVLLRDEVPLQLALDGEIIQSFGPISIAKLKKHEFRTRGLKSYSMGLRSPSEPAAVPALPSPASELHSVRQMRAAQTLLNVAVRRPALAAAAGR